MPADPPRQVPKFDVRRVQKISNPRAQEAYMAELQDTAGLCEGRVTALDMDALKVRSDEQLELNEFMLYHGSDASKFERLYHQGLDPRYAGSNAGKMYGFGTYLATNSSKSDRYARPTTQVSSASSWCARCWLSRILRPCSLEPPGMPSGAGQCRNGAFRPNDLMAVGRCLPSRP